MRLSERRGEAWRRRLLGAVVAVLGGPLLRLSIGRWPDRKERRMFAAGFIAGERIVPPVLRGLHAVPAAKRPLGQLAVLNLVREGVVRKPANYGPHLVAMPVYPGNPLSFWRGEKLAFLHFEKTAGLSFVSVLTEMFHPMQIDDDPERATAPHILSAFPDCVDANIKDKMLVWGHYDLPALRRLDKSRKVMTILREPQARVLSLYHFWRSVDPVLVAAGAVNFNVAAAHQLGLLDFLQSPDPLIRNYIDNVYVRRLIGAYAIPGAEDRLQHDPAGCVQEALANLRKLAFVWITERTEQNLPPPFSVRLPRSNAGEQNRTGAAPGYVTIEKAEVTDSVRTELQRATALDTVIYQAALEMFSKTAPRQFV